jgi:hypothetical protein
MSLYGLENNIIRKRFEDPRFHFALNCAAKGCPVLPQEAFSPEGLDSELARGAQKFLTEDRNLSINHKEQVVYLSEIMNWYQKDFLNWYQKRHPSQKATLLKAIAMHVSGSLAEELPKFYHYKVQFVPYDWRLNDQQQVSSVDP